MIVNLPDSPAGLGTAVLSTVTETGDEEVVNGTRTLEDRVVVDFGEDEEGTFRLEVSRGVNLLPGLEELPYVLEFEVAPSDLGRRSGSMSAAASDGEGSVSPIGGAGR